MNKFLSLSITAILFIALLTPSTGYAQSVGINADGSAPDASAMLDVSSTTKGFLPPRMTLAQRNLISLPATGIIIYQTDDVTGLYVNKGTSAAPDWQLLSPTAPAPSCFFFNTNTSIVNNYYVGSGSSGSDFLRNTSVVPFNCTLRSIVLSTRQLVANQNITATVYIQHPGGQPQPTQLSATILDGNTAYTAIVNNSNVPVTAGDLISVQLSTSLAGALFNGVAVSVTYQ